MKKDDRTSRLIFKRVYLSKIRAMGTHAMGLKEVSSKMSGKVVPMDPPAKVLKFLFELE